MEYCFAGNRTYNKSEATFDLDIPPQEARFYHHLNAAMNTEQHIELDSDLESSKGQGLGNQVYDALVDLILSRELQQGEQIQERSLAARLGVSRTPLREAMHRLEGERMLERRSNNRLFVRQITLQEIMEALYIRRLLESDAASRAAGKIPRDSLVTLRDRIEKLMNDCTPADPLHQRLDAELHGMISEYCGNELLAELIEQMRQKTRMFSLKRMEDRMRPVCAEHMAIIDTLIAADSEAASRETARHIDNIRQSIIDKLASYY